MEQCKIRQEKSRIKLTLLAVFGAVTTLMLSGNAYAEAEDAPHWIGLDTTDRTADAVVSASSTSMTPLDTRIVSRGKSTSKAVSGRPFHGLIICIQ